MGAATARRRVPAPAAWLREFLRLEASGGLVLMAAAVLAMVVANSPLSDIYQAGLGLLFEVRLGSFVISKPLLLWINDGLMAIFFLLVGLELKREVFEGQLSTIASASLPAFAAVGGMAVPALVYAGFNWDDPVAMKGWAIPSATDIAFALGILSLLGDRVPPALKAFLLSVAVFDDLGAIVIIALFYTSELSLLALAVAATGLAALFALNRMRVTELAAYVLIGVVLWVSVLKSGVHATLAGVALAVFIPLRGHPGKASSPVDRLEHALHPWVAFAILPLFAFANAGVSLAGLSLSDLLQPVPLGIAAGLFAGKVIGIGALCAIAVGLGLAALPGGLRWSHIVGVSFLCGVGFTMSLFIASLAFEQGGTQYPGVERLGILVGSIVSGLLGYWILRRTLLDRPSRSVP
ncbi:MAG: Na+/H+ antiporter NhaA [Gemmatimonadota bacterium]